MIKLILTDLDGTFLNDQGDFDHELYRKVKQLMDEKNIAFAPCTGKQCERVEKLFELEDAKNLWILGDSATRIKHAGNYVYESLLPNELGQAILSKLSTVAIGATVIACTPSAAFVDANVSEKDMVAVRGSYQNVKIISDYQLITEDFVKITVYDAQARCFELVKELVEFKEKTYMVASEASWIDISNQDVHKGSTVKKLQTMLNVKKSETMAFGDGLNDRELLEEARYSFAVSNAFAETKNKAKYIIGTNNDSAVLHTITDFLQA
ncbi:HAD-IIB family hydrolase [Enterococcus hermanniensis]|uniref:HAD superfamily hydrolase n=1 Tax=Enterococcus hermanniensis TaxID=249189 RepID=A0A1L8TS55_9ENTE|nr:HAD-IIB family hydrolase [Enterococcus hermanniensis]OJG47117.1 HAD superfamily hydrolase [Enterococcus hermanniensis]